MKKNLVKFKRCHLTKKIYNKTLMFSVLNGGASVTAAKIAGPAVNLKILVPAVASGAIIGKGGETIAEIQKQTGTRIKMSKANDFYPGTTERVGLLQGMYLITHLIILKVA